jgi:hypothetical protein
MNRRRVGEDRGSKEMDGCPLTIKHKADDFQSRQLSCMMNRNRTEVIDLV